MFRSIRANGRVVKMKLLQVLTILYTSYAVLGQEEYCITPTGIDGRCIQLNECDKIKNLIHGPAADREVIKQWHCGFQGLVPMVCCPLQGSNDKTTTTTTASLLPQTECTTVDNTVGTCVKLVSCRYIAKKVQELNAESLKYVLDSRCNGPATKDPSYSVCCDTTIDAIEDIFNKNLGTKSIAVNAPLVRSPTSDILYSDSSCCGTFDFDKTIPGDKAELGSYPWLAILEYAEGNDRCGGTLISSLYVLTAAHCMFTRENDPRQVKSVRLGEHDTSNYGPDCVLSALDQFDCSPGAVSIPVDSAVVHAGYKTNVDVIEPNDIALIKLSRMAPYSDFIRPICMPTSDVTESPSSNLRFTVAGWGAQRESDRSSSMKLHTDLPFVDETRCGQKYTFNGKNLIWDKQICAGGVSDKDPCKYDAGGPLMYINRNRYEVAGVISSGSLSCLAKDVPTVSTKVHSYMPWIKNLINNWSNNSS